MKFYNRYTSFSFLFFLIFNEKRRTKEKFFLRSLDYDRRISRRKMRFFHGISVIPFIGRLKFIRKQSYYNSENEIRSGNLWRREEGDMVENEMALGLSRKWARNRNGLQEFAFAPSIRPLYPNKLSNFLFPLFVSIILRRNSERRKKNFFFFFKIQKAIRRWYL